MGEAAVQGEIPGGVEEWQQESVEIGDGAEQCPPGERAPAELPAECQLADDRAKGCLGDRIHWRGRTDTKADWQGERWGSRPGRDGCPQPSADA